MSASQYFLKIGLLATILIWCLLLQFADASSSWVCSNDDISATHKVLDNNNNGCACFRDRTELKAAVDQFIGGGCSDSDNTSCNGTTVLQTYGWPMGSWCVSQVTRMDALFKNKKTFNDDISSWDTSSCTNMNHMFYRARRFNQSIESWDVSRVEDMAYLVAGAVSFDQPLAKWNTSSAITMYNMFNSALKFNQPISSWDVSSVKTMEKLFWGAWSFNQDLSEWDTSNVQDMSAMFMQADVFDQDIGGWNVSSVKNMDKMFEDDSAFHQDLSKWDISSATKLTGNMFNGTALEIAVVCGWSEAWKQLIEDCASISSITVKASKGTATKTLPVPENARTAASPPKEYKNFTNTTMTATSLLLLLSFVVSYGRMKYRIKRRYCEKNT